MENFITPSMQSYEIVIKKKLKTKRKKSHGRKLSRKKNMTLYNQMIILDTINCLFSTYSRSQSGIQQSGKCVFKANKNERQLFESFLSSSGSFKSARYCSETITGQLASAIATHAVQLR